MSQDDHGRPRQGRTLGGSPDGDPSLSTAASYQENKRHQSVESEREDLRERITTWLDAPLAFLSLLWAILVVIELAFVLPPQVSTRLTQADFVIWLIFTVVFVAEFLLATNKLSYLRRNFLSALSVVLPFVRAVRVLRLARLLRSASLVRLVLIANRATRAAGEVFSRHRFQYVLSIVVLAVLLSAAGVYYFELGVPGTSFDNFGSALWWASTMVTTINVGEEPLSVEGRIIGMLLRIVGLATFGYITASIASFFIGERMSESAEPEGNRIAEQTEAIAQLAEEVARLRATVEAINSRSGHARAEQTEMPRDEAA